MRELLKNPRVSLPPLPSPPLSRTLSKTFVFLHTTRASPWWGAEWGSKVFPLDLPKRGINHVPMKKQSRWGQKRGGLRKRGSKGEDGNIYIYASFVRVRFIAVASPSEATKKETARRESNPLKHNSRKYWYRTYLSIYIYMHTPLARARSSASFSEHPNGHSFRSLSPSLAMICPTWFGIVMQI